MTDPKKSDSFIATGVSLVLITSLAATPVDPKKKDETAAIRQECILFLGGSNEPHSHSEQSPIRFPEQVRMVGTSSATSSTSLRGL